MSELERIRDVVIRDGRVQLTDTHGQTVQLANLNTDLSIRPPGQTSKLKAGAVVLAAQQNPGQLTVVGQATPSKKTGWSLKGTTGDLTVDVNDLNLASVAPFLDLAGLQVQARGQVSGHITSAVQDGQIQNVNGTITGQDLDITGETLKGDRLQTSQLNATVNLAQAGEVIDVNQLDVRTDWATVSLTGTLPKTPGTLSQLLESGASLRRAGQLRHQPGGGPLPDAAYSRRPSGHAGHERPGHRQHQYDHRGRPGHRYGQGPGPRTGRGREQPEGRSQRAGADRAAALHRQTGGTDR